MGDSNTFFGTITDVHPDADRASIETDFGTFTASTTNLYSDPESVVGQQMPLSVRPQYMSLSSEHENTLECSVTSVIHQQGSGTQVILAVENGDSTKEIQLKSHELLDIDRDRITVGWSAENTTLLEKTSVVDGVDLEKDILGE